MIAELPLFLKIKVALVAACGLNADALHIYLGVGCLILTTFFSRDRVAKWSLLIPGLVVSVLVEVGDLYYDFSMTGSIRNWESLQDIVNTNLMPFLIIALLRLGAWRGSVLPKPEEAIAVNKTV